MSTNTVDTVALNSARIMLSGAIIQLAARTVAETGIRYQAQADAPNEYDALLSAYATAQNTLILPVWNGASNHALYLSPHTNHAFRYWHDMGHVQHGMSFTYADEYDLQYHWHAPAIADIVGYGSLAWQLYWADTVGQLEYANDHHAFPSNQLAFDVAYVEDSYRALRGEF